MEAPWVGDITQDDVSYQGLKGKRITLKECVTPYTEADFHTLPNLGNDPSFLYLLRNRKWQGEK